VVSTSGTGGGSSSSGGPDDGGKGDGPVGPCSAAADCTAMNDPCNVGVCVNGTCQDGLGVCNADASCAVACHVDADCADDGKDCTASDTCHIGTCDEAADASTEAPGTTAPSVTT
jgi:hypothetical protein